MLENYRPTMTEDVLHSWAEDAQAKILMQHTILYELRKTLEKSYSTSPEGRAYLAKMDKVINA